MATDKTGTWGEGESILWYTPTTSLDTEWAEGGSMLLDEYEAPVGGVAYPKVNIGGAWKTVSDMKVNIGGAWKSVSAIKVNIGGTWKNAV